MLWVLVVIVLLLLVASVWLNVRLVKQNLMLNDQREVLVNTIEESLDSLDACYSRLAHHASVPVLSDEPIIQEVVHDLKVARNTVLAIASKVVTYGNDEKASEEDEG